MTHFNQVNTSLFWCKKKNPLGNSVKTRATNIVLYNKASTYLSMVQEYIFYIATSNNIFENRLELKEKSLRWMGSPLI